LRPGDTPWEDRRVTAVTDIALPPGVRLLQTLRGHTAPLGQVAWSPDGRLLATSSKDYTVKVWDASSGTCLHTIVGHEDGVRAVAFDREGTVLASGADDATVRLWETEQWQPIETLSFEECQGLAFSASGLLAAAGDSEARLWDASTRAMLHNLRGQTRYLTSVAFDRNGEAVATASRDGTVMLWSATTGERIFSLEGDAGGTNDVAFDPAGNVVATGDDDNTVRIWSREDGTLRAELEGHTSAVRSVSYSHDGRFLASKSLNDVRVWDSRTGACVCELPVIGESIWMPKIAFHPSSLHLAAVGTDPGIVLDDKDAGTHDTSDCLVQIFELDAALLGAAPSSGVTYASAKIVLVGDSGVGKTGLGWRLAHGEFREHASTHGQQFWTLDQLGHVRADGAECEAVLWDLAGQPDYRLVHALFLDDADLALVLFDPTRDDDPLRGVEYWLRQLGVAPDDDDAGADAILVAARADRGSARLTTEEVEAFCTHRGLHGYVVTSAMSGEGLDQLLERVRTAIQWGAKPATVTTETFKRIKDDVLALRENPDQTIIVSPAELRERLEQDPDLGAFSDEEMLTAVGHLSNHGYVSRLTTSLGEIRILLAPELLNNVAASIVLEARRNEKGLGSLEEHRVLADGYHLRELEHVAEDDRKVLLDSAVAMFLAHNVCFRETDPLTSRVYLVFPELINLKRPASEDEQPVEEGVAYTVSGSVENVYASLVVLLGYTSTFTRTNQWRNHAQYVMGEGLVCGFRVETERDGQLDFVLYFGSDVGEPVRNLFQGLFESFLTRRDLTVRRYEPVICSNGHRLNRAVVREELSAGNDFVFCARCGERLHLDDSETPIQLTKGKAPALISEHRTADARSRFEHVLFRLNAHVTQEHIVPPECFISYAWGEPAHERWVEQDLAIDLTKSGITVILDRWENARIGASVPRFVERAASADRVIVVGTPLYRSKYDNGEPMRGFVVAAEGDLIGKRLIGTEVDKESVLPLLLEGTDASFPALLRPRVHADFRDPSRYFTTMLDLILSLYGISPRMPVSVELRSLLG
jgi:WD40 repeat protein